jgi:hypothetical protein
MKINLKKKRFILAHGFRGFSPCLLGSFISGPVLRQSTRTEERGRGKLLTVWQPGREGDEIMFLSSSNWLCGGY